MSDFGFSMAKLGQKVLSSWFDELFIDGFFTHQDSYIIEYDIIDSLIKKNKVNEISLLIDINKKQSKLNMTDLKRNNI